MSFHSIHYLIFFPFIAILYYIVPRPRQWLLLLIASCFFYLAFIPVYIFLPVFLIILDYFSAIVIEKLKARQKRILFIASLILNLLPLLIFKYSGFLLENIHVSTPSLNFIVPLGLSFYTLQSLGYIIDVYRGNQKAEKNFGSLALFIMFFPQIISGPIERASRMIPQFKQPHPYEEPKVTDGLLLIVLGFYKKIVVADNLAAVSDQVFNNPYSYAGIPFALAAVVFAFQIYYDFSGYTDIARGSAKVLGFNLIENFNHPYLSVSIQDFWRRWHISLSSWLRDYVYIPLGGNRTGRFRKYFNILITFLISGLWHGAGWNFILWGAYNGLCIIATDISSGFKKFSRITSNKIFSIPVSFILICIGWIIFRSSSIKTSLYIISQLPNSLISLFKNHFTLDLSLATKNMIYHGEGQNFITPGNLIIIILTSIILIELSPRLPRWSLWFISLFAVIAILNLGVIKSVPFIYSQF